MFSSDVAKIRLAELKAKGDHGKIQRLRQCCFDAAGVFEEAAAILEGSPLLKEHRRVLAAQLRRGAVSLTSVAKLSAPGSRK
jgi:hypothetical protein